MQQKANKIVCPNCGTENPIYAVSCTNCNSFIRKKIVNINLWAIIWKLLYSPVEAAKEIIFAEHKNFAFTVLSLILIKLFLLKISLTYIIDEYSNYAEHIISNFFILSAVILVYFLLFSLMLMGINRILKYQTRFKDNLALIVFSFVPLLLSLVLLTPVEYALFGKYWFLSNPYPILVKPAAAWIFYVLEGIMLVWSVVIYTTSLFAQTMNKIYSLSFSLIFFCLLFAGLYFTL